MSTSGWADQQQPPARHLWKQATSGRSTRHADQRLGLTAGPATGSRRGDVRESGLG